MKGFSAAAGVVVVVVVDLNTKQRCARLYLN